MSNIREIKRQVAIDSIVNVLAKAKKDKVDVDMKKLVNVIMVDNHVSKRTAQEYLEIANHVVQSK